MCGVSWRRRRSGWRDRPVLSGGVGRRKRSLSALAGAGAALSWLNVCFDVGGAVGVFWAFCDGFSHKAKAPASLVGACRLWRGL